MKLATNTPTVIVTDGPIQPSLPIKDHWRPLALVYQDKRNGAIHVALQGWEPTARDFEEVMVEAKAKGITALLVRASRKSGGI